MRYLSLHEVLELHDRLIGATGGARGIRDLGALQSAASQPRLTFGGVDLYPDTASKATALRHSLVLNHPFIDGNKRVGHAAMETFLVLNGLELEAEVPEQERLLLELAAGRVSRQQLGEWVREHATAV